MESSPAPPPRTRQRKRRGIALIWLAISMVALIGLVALGIDMGRLKLAHTELQTAADAAARAAVWPVPELRFADGVARAEALMDTNDAGGAPIGFDVNQDDLVYGIWWRNTRSFEPLEGPLLVRANAVMIRDWRHSERGNPLPMGFAGIVGFDEVDVAAVAVAQIRGGFNSGSGGFGVFGRDYIRSNGDTKTDSYDPTQGPYDPNSAGDDGGIGTNGYLEILGTSDINGSARWGPDGDIDPDNDYIDVWPNADVTGWQAPLDEDLIFPPAVAPSTYNNQPLMNAGMLTGKGKKAGNNIDLSASTTYTMPGGTSGSPNIYVVGDFTMRGDAALNVAGPVEIYVTGDLDLAGGTVTNNGDGTGWPLPGNFKIFVVGSGDVRLGGGSALYAQIYAPQSVVEIHGTSDSFGLFGGVIGKSVDIRGNSAIHVDTSLEWPGQRDEFWVELVH